MIDLTIESILEYLKGQRFDAKIQTETDQVYIIFKILDREFPLFIKVFKETYILQLLIFIPCNTKASTLPGTARLLHMINKEMDVPGFGMDENNNLVFYRLMIPALNAQIDPYILDTLLNTMQTVCKTFAPVVINVASGMMKLEDLLKKGGSIAEQQQFAPKAIRPTPPPIKP